MEGAQNALAVTVGKAAAKAIPQQLAGVVPLPTTGAAAIATQAAVALAVGMAAEKFVGRKWAPFIMAGALTAPIEQAIRAANVPVLSSALSGVGAYPMLQPARRRAPMAGVGAYATSGVYLPSS